MSIVDAILAFLIVALGGCGTFLILPHRHGTARPRKLRRFGAISAGLGLLLFVTLWQTPGPFLATVFFYSFALAAIVGGLMMIASRDPIHSALWFASVVLATAGLFIFAGAPFLAAGTVIIYAGAIIVTFLFVIMLAQLEGKAAYDRAARSPGRATITSFVIFWCLIYVLSAIKSPSLASSAGSMPEPLADTSLPAPREIAGLYNLDKKGPIVAVLDRSSLRETAQLVDREGREKPNTAGLGESLYSDHLITAGLAGVLLFVALVGAIAIANPRRAQGDEPARMPAT
ncbi:MAG: NADH-quinone oxidoreductase subunit J [Isosphaeraceae bacterium]